MFRGFYTALVTPFSQGRFDVSGFEQQIAIQVKHGAHGIVPTGTTGESPTLSHEEHRHVVEVAVGAAKGTGLKVIAGTGSKSTQEAVELTRHARQAGADGALLVNPYYNKPTQEGLFRHFREIAKAVDIPIVLYNIPGRTAVTLSVPTVIRLAKECPNIVAIKEATGSLDQASETIAGCKLTVLSGDDSLTLPLMAVGAVGVVSVAGNIVPGEIRKLVDLAAANDFAAARTVHLKLFPLIKALFLETNPIPVKAAMAMLGRDTGDMRLPLCEPTAATAAAIRQALADYGLL